MRPAEAHKLGLIDRVVPTGQLMEEAEIIMKDALKVSDTGRQGTKAIIRNELSHRWEAGCLEESKSAWLSLTDPKTVMMLEAVMQSLSRGKASKSNL